MEPSADPIPTPQAAIFWVQIHEWDGKPLRVLCCQEATSRNSTEVSERRCKSKEVNSRPTIVTRLTEEAALPSTTLRDTVIVYRQAAIEVYLYYLPHTAWSVPDSHQSYPDALQLYAWEYRYCNSLVDPAVVDSARCG